MLPPAVMERERVIARMPRQSDDDSSLSGMRRRDLVADNFAVHVSRDDDGRYCTSAVKKNIAACSVASHLWETNAGAPNYEGWETCDRLNASYHSLSRIVSRNLRATRGASRSRRSSKSDCSRRRRFTWGGCKRVGWFIGTSGKRRGGGPRIGWKDDDVEAKFTRRRDTDWFTWTSVKAPSLLIAFQKDSGVSIKVNRLFKKERI